MKRKKRRRKNPPYTRIILLAYVHRYVIPILAVFLPQIMLKQYVVLGRGIGMTFFALYTLIGYLCRWKHIYCSFQNAAHQHMTPSRIHWSNIRKADAYGVPAIFGALGLAMIICHFFVL